MPKTYAHDMPFGAQLLPDGQTRFRLWAPDQNAVALVLEEPERIVPMTRSDDGFCVVTTAAPPGSRYRFQLAGGVRVPDPASRHQPEDVHGPSEVIDPKGYAWQRDGWRGRPWHEAVVYELHVGAFSSAGNVDGLLRKLDYLAELGVTALELMPVADFPGKRNWGYDGVLLFAPDATYGRPADLKRLVDEAHARELMVLLDVVYNHFGPEGNYLSEYAGTFFHPTERTPWGQAINYGVRAVRDFAIHNALYWLNEYRFDGLRLDAVDHIVDQSEPHILTELATAIRSAMPADRHVHLVLENDLNEVRWLERSADRRPVYYDAQWNDDIHHLYHHLATNESGGYYADYTSAPHQCLAKALSTGFAYQGESSGYRHGAVRGTRSEHLPPTSFVAFVQNHDQIGNRAFGERITRLAPEEAVKALQAILLLAPNIPLLFMGEEWGATQPFHFFADFSGALSDSVRAGRRREVIARWNIAASAQDSIPDPNAVSTFVASRLDWEVGGQSTHAAWLAFVRSLLEIRRRVIVPGLPCIDDAVASTTGSVVDVAWRLSDESELRLVANLAPEPSPQPIERPPDASVLFVSPGNIMDAFGDGPLPPWSVIWFRRERSERSTPNRQS